MTDPNPWTQLAGDYETARLREDSFDRILEWPVQKDLLGDVTGMHILDVGCGSGAKAAFLAEHGAARVTGVDISGRFIDPVPSNVQLIKADLSELDKVDELRRQTFDRVVFFQSLGYARDQAHTLTYARALLAPRGRIIVQRSHPIRFAVERAEANGTSLGAEYYNDQPYSYASGWNQAITLTHSTETFSSMLNTFAAARLHIEHAVEPQLSPADRARYPHKQKWLDKYLGVIFFILRPI